MINTFFECEFPKNLLKSIKIKVVGAHYDAKKEILYETKSNNCKRVF